MQNLMQTEGVYIDTPKTLTISDSDSSKSIENKISFSPRPIRVTQEVKEKIHSVLSETPLKNTYIKNGVHYLITIVEKESLELSFKKILKNFGRNQKYNPDAEYQRRGAQHTKTTRCDILISILSGENVGLIVMKKNPNDTWDIVDGKQRMEVVYDFLKNALEISSDKSADFWKLFLNDRFLYKENITDEDDLKITNTILKNIQVGKFPKVIYEKLPTYIQEYIVDEFQLNGMVANVTIKNLSNNITIFESDENYSKDEVGKAILKKFIDINKNKKVISSPDILWASGKDCILLNRQFLSELPNMGNIFGYLLKYKDSTNDLDDTNEVRKFMMLLSRASMIYQGDLSWGDSEKKLVGMILDKDKGDFSPRTSDVFKKMISCFEKGLFSQTYFQGNLEKELHIPVEFNSSRSDILKLSYFTMMWYMTEHIEKNPNEYMKAGEGKTKLFKLVEKVSEYLTLGKLANIDHEFWDREPHDGYSLNTYNLKDEFFSNETFENTEVGIILHKVKDFNQHQAGLSRDYAKTFRKLIRYAETKI